MKFVIDSQEPRCRFFDYLEFEGVIHELVPIEQADFDHEDYIYIFAIQDFDTRVNYFRAIDQRILEAARYENVRLVFWVDPEDPTVRLIDYHSAVCEMYGIDYFNLKFMMNNYVADNLDPFVYFCDQEIEFRMQHAGKPSESKIATEQRPLMFVCKNNTRSQLAYLLQACIWQHGMDKLGYLSVENVPDSVEMIETWTKYFDRNQVLMAQFEINAPETELTTDSYNNTYVSFVCSDYHAKRNVVLNQNVFEAIQHYHPFLIFGSPMSLDALRSLGYKTFKGYFDEDYDRTHDPETRAHELFIEVHRILNHATLPELIEHIAPILEHNKRILFTSKRERLDATIDRMLE